MSSNSLSRSIVMGKAMAITSSGYHTRRSLVSKVPYKAGTDELLLTPSLAMLEYSPPVGDSVEGYVVPLIVVVESIEAPSYEDVDGIVTPFIQVEGPASQPNVNMYEDAGAYPTPFVKVT